MSDSSDPMDCSLPGSSAHGIFQARVLEWGVTAFSDTVYSRYQKSYYLSEKLSRVNDEEMKLSTILSTKSISIKHFLLYLGFIVISNILY